MFWEHCHFLFLNLKPILEINDFRCWMNDYFEEAALFSWTLCLTCLRLDGLLVVRAYLCDTWLEVIKVTGGTLGVVPFFTRCYIEAILQILDSWFD